MANGFGVFFAENVNYTSEQIVIILIFITNAYFRQCKCIYYALLQIALFLVTALFLL